MHLSKEEMVRIWEKEPIDYLKTLTKKTKGKKKFKITLKPYTELRTYYDEISETVLSKTARSAEIEYGYKVRSALFAQQKADLYPKDIKYTITTVEVK